MIFDDLYNISLSKAKHKIWIFSDLQQGNPKYAKECLDVSVADYKSMGKPADMMWYLGDSIEGFGVEHIDHVLKMTEMQIKTFEGLDIPLCYVMGNHEIQFSNGVNKEKPFVPIYDEIRKHSNWHTTKDYDDWYFKIQLGEFVVYFISEHTTQGNEPQFWVSNEAPKNDVYYNKVEKLKAEMKNETCPIITASHYSFPGGNRASNAFNDLFPLPKNHKIHFYGHAHIGDYKWAKENAYRRISSVDWHDIPQVNVSSFEHIRGNTCRSVFLHIYNDNTMGVFFRDHDNRCFTECYFPSEKRYGTEYEKYNPMY